MNFKSQVESNKIRSMSFRNLRQISERYANEGNREDVDEFRAEMNRVAQEQRFQTIERYISDLYADFPYLVRNRQFQFVPSRNQRLSELIQIATNQQLEAYRQAAEVQEKAKVDAKARQDAIDAAKKDASAVFPSVSNNLLWLVIVVAGLLLLLLILLIIMVWKLLMNRSSHSITVVEKIDENNDKIDPSLTASAM